MLKDGYPSDQQYWYVSQGSRYPQQSHYLNIPIHTKQDEAEIGQLEDSNFAQSCSTVLIKSTLAAIPIYTMQTDMIPKQTLDEIDRLCRRFFWGEQGNERRLHTIMWSTLCQPKDIGGLGMPQLLPLNKALLAKLVWRKLTQPWNVGSSVLIGKYGEWGTSEMAHKNNTYSAIWREMLYALPLLRCGIRWTINSGQQEGFWQDAQPEELLSRVAAYWRSGRGQKMEQLQGLLSVQVLAKLILVVVQKPPGVPDCPIWGASLTGQFSTRSARLILRGTHRPLGPVVQRAVWGFAGPLRASFTLWFSMHGALPTRAFLWKRSIVSNPLCGCCDRVVQTALHVLRDCPIS